MPEWWIYPVIGGFLLSVVFTDLIAIAAKRYGIVDAPDGGKKLHKVATPLFGGVAIFLSFAITVIAVLLFSDHFTSGEITDLHFLGFLLGGLVLMVGGALDDKFDLPARVSIIFPVAAALLAVFFGIGVDKVTNPAGGAFEITDTLSNIFTFVWLMGMMYTTKLLDGMDGLSTGVSAIAASMIALLALSVAYFQPDVALLALIAAAVLLGFLLWNTHPAQIFLGEGGSTFVGYLVGTLAVISGGKLATALLVLGIPALDVFFVMLGRLRSGKPIFTRGDRSHLHHRLLNAGLGHRQVVALYYVVAILFGLTTLVFESWQKLVALVVLFVLMTIALYFLSKQSYGRKENIHS
jgi:UDP-GlcNAc:undecaprenyl-phosphate GlcNAc-1-phosphate transferase